MNLLYIGKYPPIQGGVATAAYWRLKELNKRGINIHVVTCDQRNTPYRTEGVGDSCCTVLDQSPMWHIPYSPLYSERLVSTCLEFAETNRVDMVEGNYLFPFGFAAWTVARILGKPLVLRHAGSDINRVTSSSLRSVLKAMLNDTHTLVTYLDCIDYWQKCWGVPFNKLWIVERYVPSSEFWDYSENEEDRGSSVVFIGKITQKWQVKRFEILENEMKNLQIFNKLVCYTGGDGVKSFQEYFLQKGFMVEVHPFVHPAKVPEILKGARYVFVPKTPAEMHEVSNVLLEGLATGCYLISGEDDFRINSSGVIELLQGNVNLHRREIFKNLYQKYIEGQLELYSNLVN